LVAVEAALRRLQYEYTAGGTVVDYYNNPQEVDIVVRIPGQRDVGFKQDVETGTISLVGDWWGGAVKEQQFLDSLTANYSREVVLDSLEQQGFDLSKITEVEEADGAVVFTVPLDDEDLELLIAAR